MKDLKFLGLSFLLFGAAANAQDANEAKKAIDAEQFQKAKTILKSLIASTPDDGKNYFLLGDVYLTQTVQDSAALYFNKGLAAKDNPEYNNIGLGHIDLNANNAAAAQAKFAAVEKDLRKKDVEQLVYIGRAYIYADNPDYKKAVAVLNKAVEKDSKNALAYMYLGEAYYRDRDQNNAYKNYRTATTLDPSLLRAKLQLGVITKNTRAAFPEAVKAFNDIIAVNANYGPVYRELAETYYLWGNTETSKKTEYNAKALGFYEKYMSLTDYSLDSRMRHADFLLLTGDYKALEAEAQKMQQMDKVNPRILRYAGYAAYENGNYDASVKAISEFINKVEPKRVIARDYLYRGLANLATVVGKDAEGNSTITDQAKFDAAIADIKKAAETDAKITNEFNDIGKKLFSQKLYSPAAAVFEVAAASPENKNAFYDNFYLAYSIYYGHVNKSDADKKANTEQLLKADAALDKVIELSATSQDAYLFKARINRNLSTDDAYAKMAKAYDGYIKIVNEAGAAETSKPAVIKNLVEAYDNAGAYYAVTDKAKAKDYFSKAVALDPNDTYAKGELKKL
ncbi:tetratricopeptide repeat protein [Flavobacterium sp. Sd200]|uniref:tetratricopeptide repeat protein n=1 Tax=Flavobacterium sp. Sd200 TaxID=2692211 RepID=UPI00136E8E34|nr:tetratricopeptide repeat protein [Flavobacterium sp. Sd200]MXN92895.1 tetratricopeptide repeat protein [Flavobacterium sp. Sd200]